MDQFSVMQVDTNSTCFLASQFQIDLKMTRTLFLLTLTRKKSYRFYINSSYRNSYCQPLKKKNLLSKVNNGCQV